MLITKEEHEQVVVKDVPTPLTTPLATLDTDLYMGMAETMHALGYTSPGPVARLVKSKQLRAFRVGRRYRFLISDVVELVEKSSSLIQEDTVS